ncbi:hypothetical protein D3C78_1946540 [compost metagenome]
MQGTLLVIDTGAAQRQQIGAADQAGVVVQTPERQVDQPLGADLPTLAVVQQGARADP